MIYGIKQHNHNPAFPIEKGGTTKIDQDGLKFVESVSIKNNYFLHKK